MVKRRLSNSSNSLTKDVLVHAGPGAGKTIGALLSFKRMKQEGLIDYFIIFCHRNSIASQWEHTSKEIGLKIEEWNEKNTYLNNRQQNIDGLLVTYQEASIKNKFIKKSLSELGPKSVLAIADEAHHLGVNPDEPESSIWGQSFLEITDGTIMRMGLTGTPFRADNLAFCSAKKIKFQTKGEIIEQITPDISVQPKELIEEGDVRPLEFHFQDGFIEHGQLGLPDREVSSLSGEKRESWRSRNLRRAIHLSDSSSIAFQLLKRARKKLEQIRITHKEAGGLIIAKDIDHAKKIARLLEEEGDLVDLVHSKDNNANERLKGFKTGNAKWLVSIDMCSEGFDAPRIRIVAYLTTVITKSRFLQGITRAVRISRTRSAVEAVPREPSFVFAPADPLLMDHARGWSLTSPYLIKRKTEEIPIESFSPKGYSPNLPHQAIKDKASELIRINSVELPKFLQR